MIISKSVSLTKLLGICILLNPKTTQILKIKLAKTGPKTGQIRQIPPAQKSSVILTVLERIKRQVLYLLSLGCSKRFILNFLKLFYGSFIICLFYMTVTVLYPRTTSNEIYHNGLIVSMLLWLIVYIWLLLI